MSDSSSVNQVQLIISATDRASAVIAQTTQEVIKLGNEAIKAGNEAAVAVGAVLVGAILNAKDAFIGLYRVIQSTDNLLRKFANTTLKDVFVGLIDSLAGSLSNAMNYQVTEILKTLGQTSRLAVGLDVDQPGLSRANDAIEQELQRMKKAVAKFSTEAAVEVDLLGLKIEQSFGQNADYLVDEFEKIKRNLVEIAREGGLDASAEIEFAALKLQTLADAKGIAVSFDPTIQAAEAAETKIEELSTKTANTVAQSVARSAGRIVNGFDRAFQTIQGNYTSAVAQITGIGNSLSGITFSLSGGEEALALFNSLKDGANQFLGTVQGISEQIFFFSQALDILKSSVITGPYEILIGQNVKLREQLLATQSTLAATNKVIQNGVQIKDSTQAIQALGTPVATAIAQIRKESLDLVNVTSKDLVESFQIIAGQAGNIGFNLTQAKDLTISFGATLGTLGIPLYMANQEITSILTGTIDMNSVVAKSLGLTNQQVEIWKQQGTLVDNLNKKMEAFRAGNKLASQTLGGVTSNIQELFDNVGLAAGGKALDVIVQKANQIYEYLKVNQTAITQFVTQVTNQLTEAFSVLADGLAAVFGSTQDVAINTIKLLIDAFATAITVLGNSLKTAAVIATPFMNILAELAKMGAIINPLFQVAVQAKVLAATVGLVTGSLGGLARTIPFVGELLFLMQIRGSGVIGMLTGLNQAAGIGASGFLTLGANLDKIPFLMNAVAGKLPFFGKEIASLIPTLSKGGAALISLGQKSPDLIKFIGDVGIKAAESGTKGGQAFASLSKGLTSLLSGANASEGVKGIASAFSEVAQGNAFLAPLADTFKNIAENTNLAEVANKKFAAALAEARGVAIRMVLNFGAIALIIGAAVLAINEFILKNEANRKFLVGVGQAIKSFGENVYKFLSSPIGIATLAITGLTIAIRTGLITTIADAAKSFARLTSENTPKWFGVVAEEAKKFNNTLRDLGSGNFDQVFGGKKQELQERSDFLKTELKNTAGEYKQSISDRKSRISQIDDEMLIADPEKAKAAGIRPVGDLEALKAEKDKLQAEITNIQSARKAQGAAIVSLRKEAAEIPTLSDRIGSTVTKGFDKATGSITQFKGVAQRLGGDSLTRLGEAVSTIGFDALGQKVTKTGNDLYALGAQTLASEKALKGFGGAIDASNINLQGIANGATKAVGAVKSVASAAIQATSSMLSAAAPTLAFVAAVAVLTTAVSLYTSISEAGTKSTKAFTEAFQESDRKIQQLERERANRQGQTQGQAGFDEQKEKDKRIKEIRESRGFIEKALTGGGVAAGLVDYGQTGNIDSLQFDREKEDSTKAIEEAKKKLATLQQAQGAIASLEDQNANLQKTRAEKAAKGDEQGVKDIDAQIKRNQEEIDERKKNIDIAVESAQKIRPLTKQQAADQAEVVNQLKNTRAEAEKLRDTKIAPVDLPRVGGAFEQLSSKIQSGLSALEKGGGNKEDVEKKVKETIEATQQLFKSGTISEEQARATFSRIAGASNLATELQQQAQEALTSTFQTESNRRIELIQAEQGLIARDVQQGTITQAEGERQLSNLKVAESEERLSTLRNELNEQNRLQANQLESTQTDVAQKIIEAQDRLNAARAGKDTNGKALSPTEQKDAIAGAEKELDAQRQRQATAQTNYANFVGENNRKLVVQEQQTAQARIEAQKTVTNSYIQEAERQTQQIDKQISAVEAQQAAGKISGGKADEEISRLREQSLQAQLDGVNKAIESTKEGSDERIALEAKAAKLSADIAKNRADFQIRQLDRVTQKALDEVKESSTLRQTEAAQLFNEGVLSQEELGQAQAQIAQQVAQNELSIEQQKLDRLKKIRNPNDSEVRAQRLKVLDLARQVVEGEAKLFDAYINVLKSKLQDVAQEYSNELESQSQQLQAQVRLLDAVNSALEQRSRLLKAGQDLIKGTADYLTGELDALAKIEKSETKKKELARASAVIKLAALQKEQEIALQLFEIEQQRNRLALQRRDIENQVAIAKQKAEIAKGSVDIQVAGAQLKAGRISQAEYDATVLKQQANVTALQGLELESGLIQQEKALQPQLEAAARQQFKLRQRSEETNALVGVYETARPSDQRVIRRALQQRAAQGAGFEDYGSFTQNLNQMTNEFIGQQFFNRPGETNPFESLSPNRARILQGLNPDQVALPTGLPTALPQDLVDVVSKVGQTAQGVNPGFKLPSVAGVKLTNDALSVQQASLPPGILDGVVQQATQTNQTMKEVAQGLEALKAVAGNTIQLESVNVNVYTQGGDVATAQTSGNAVRRELDNIFKKAEAAVRSN